MKQKFLCIRPLHGEAFDGDFADPAEIEAFDADEAAHDFCEVSFADWSYPKGPIIVLVRDPDGIVTEFQVEISYEPVFHAFACEPTSKQCEHRHVLDGRCIRCMKPMANA